MSFDYFYGQQAEQFSFYRIPKVLFTDERFWEISTDAKLLYGILLDRMNLSAKNGWLDEAGRVYIIYTIEEAQAALHCGDKKVTKLFSELEKKCGLIERKRQGLGKPNLIYVKNFIDSAEDNVKSNIPEGRILNRQNDDSGPVKNTILDSSKVRCNNTEINNNTEYSDNNLIFPSFDDEKKDGAVESRDRLKEDFMRQIEYDYLLYDPEINQDLLDEILELLVDTCYTNRKMISIAGDDKPTEVVKSQFMKLDSEHIRYVMTCMRRNTTEVKNMKQYLLTSLYNAPMTINNYYSSLVQHDMAGKW